MGFNVETVQFKNIRLQVWDLGGQDKLRRVWNTYYIGAAAVVLVVDSMDRARLPLLKEELTAITVHEELQTAALLVLANKQAARVFSACALGAASAASRLAGPRHGPCGEAAGSPRAPPPRHLLRGQLVACRLALVAWRL